MNISFNEVVFNLPNSDFEKITIIPTNYSIKANNKYYNDTASSFYKFAKNRMDIGVYSSLDVCLVQKSADWFGPVFYVGEFIAQNYSSLITLVDLISEYIKSKYYEQNVNVKFEIVAKDKNKGTFTSIKYDGPSNAIKDVIQSFDKLSKK